MQREFVNPWTWNEKLGFVHGHKVTGAREIYYLAGQIAHSHPSGKMPKDMTGQLTQTIENIDTILKQGGMDFSHVTRLNVYVTDMPAMMAAHDHMVERLAAKGCKHAGTLLGVIALAAPDALVEIEVTAAR